MYRFNKKTLEFVKVYQPPPWLGMLITIVLTTLILVFILPDREKRKIEHEAKVIVAKQNEFSEEKLIKLIDDLHFPFPHIVLAQAMHETALYTSPVFKENNNLFGTKYASRRVTLTQQSSNGYAYFNNWQESVYDYAFYYSTYLSRIIKEEEYFDYLSQYYAEDVDYTKKLVSLIEQHQLKQKFN